MKKIKVVIGANFGDEGKGLMTDYFCSLFEPSISVLNVRFNGTCQAGHTVVKGSKRHVFSHFGAGSFNSNVTTYLSSDFFVNPILFNEEYTKLLEIGVKPIVKIAKNAPIITIYDVLYNRFLESSRFNERHGSCGLGLWEAVLRNDTSFNLLAEDLKLGIFRLGDKVKNIRDSYFKEKATIDNLIITSSFEQNEIDWFDNFIIDAFIEECKLMLTRVELVEDSEVLNQFECIVFEGAQGLLLDWQNLKYMPNLTASRTGLFNVNKLLSYIEETYDLEVCYVSRSYFTRHGAGLFVTEVNNREQLGIMVDDKTNYYNNWQGNFRYGYFDVDLFFYSINKDLLELTVQKKFKKSICITHLDDTNEIIKLLKKDVSIYDFITNFGDDWNFYISKSNKSKNIKQIHCKLPISI